MIEVWIATSNSGKLNEFKTLLSTYPIDIHSQNELKVYSAPPETGKTYLENAKIKTKALRSVKPNLWVAGEDSGIEVEGLDGLPGIHSARYSGERSRDSENVAKVLKMLKLRNPTLRAAKFKCSLVAFSPAGEEFVFESSWEGRISEKVSGAQGFGYDPIFIPNGETLTAADLGLAFKNRHSHRAQAIRMWIEELKKSL